MNKEIINQPRAIEHSFLFGLSDRPLSIGATLLNIMSTTIKYNQGMSIGDYGCIYISETKPHINKKDLKFRRKALFQCGLCGNAFISTIQNVKRNKTKSCGCFNIKSHTKHGMCFKFGYILWRDMKCRILNPKANNYKNYGGRGITIFPPWKEDFQLFYDYVSALPDFGVKGLTLDRIDNNGNYEPDNIRWATRHTQNANMRMRSINKSGYIGVSYIKDKNIYKASISVNYKTIHLGYFKDSVIAARRRDNYIKINNLTEYTLNFE